MNRHFHTIALLLGILIIPLLGQAQLPGSGNAYDFNSSYISVPHSAVLNPNNISIEAWIKADSWGVNPWENVIVSKDGWASGDEGYVLRAGANGTLSFNFSLGTSWTELNSASGAMVTGQWYHVAGTFDGATMKIYINGVEVGTKPASGIINTGTYDLNIGRAAYTVGGNRYFDGMIDEVRIWDSGIPQSSIQEYMCQKITPLHPNYASLVGHWDLDDAGPVLDLSPNGNNGTNNGATHNFSGAPIGDESIFNYGGGSVDMTLNWMGSDSVQVISTSALNTIHLYRVDQEPNTIASTGAVDSIDNSHYYGVFTASNSAYSYDLVYHYGATPMTLGNESYLNIVGRSTPNGSPWQLQGATIDQALNTLTKAYTTDKEVFLGLACPVINLNNSGTINLCDGETVDLLDLATNSNYQWNNDLGVISGETTSSYTVSTASTYYLVANSGYCTDTSNLIIVTTGTSPTVDFGTLNSTFCENDADELILNGLPIGGTYSGVGIIGNDFSPATAGIGTQTLYYDYTDGNGCSNTDSMDVMVETNPTISSITDDNLGSLCILSSGVGMTYTWILDGNVVNSGVDTCLTATANGNYQVFASNSSGCSSDTTSALVGYIGINDVYLNDNVVITPNPTQDELFVIIADGFENATITLTDAKGRVLNQLIRKKNTVQLNLGDQEPGVYFVIVELSSSKVVKRVVKY